MTKLPAARPSPRVAGGVLRWYAGDTFTITLRLELQDQDGEAVTVGADDSVTVRFSICSSMSWYFTIGPAISCGKKEI